MLCPRANRDYDGFMTVSIADLMERLRKGPELVEEAVRGAAPAELDYSPGPGKWSARQIVAHMADSEMVGADRFRRVVAENNPTIMAYDEKAWAANLDYGRRDPQKDIALFRLARNSSYDLLHGLPESAFDRAGNHSERGPVTIHQFLEIYASHAEAHAKQIRAAREAYRQRQS